MQAAQLQEHLFKVEMVVQSQAPKVVLVAAAVTLAAAAAPTKLRHQEHLMEVAAAVRVISIHPWQHLLLQ
jgi:hypothetical protein